MTLKPEGHTDVLSAVGDSVQGWSKHCKEGKLMLKDGLDGSEDLKVVAQATTPQWTKINFIVYISENHDCRAHQT